MPVPSIVIAEKTLSTADALERLEQYPLRTPKIYDFPSPGEPSAITADEVARTRAVNSRISAVESDWFISLASTAPWTPTDCDLRDADPAEPGGPYDSMLSLYVHFAGAAPKGVSTAKISKVLHLKRPTQFPILDSRLMRIYANAAARTAACFPSRGNRRMYWAAIKLDLERSTDGLAKLRSKIAVHPAARVQVLQALTDLRLHDMLAW